MYPEIIDPVEVLFVAQLNHLWDICRGSMAPTGFEELSKLHQQKYLDEAWAEFRKSRAETLEMQERLNLRKSA